MKIESDKLLGLIQSELADMKRSPYSESAFTIGENEQAIVQLRIFNKRLCDEDDLPESSGSFNCIEF